MKTGKKSLVGAVLLLCVALVATVALVACGGGGGTEDAAESPEPAVRGYQIGAVQPIEHPALDTIYQGFVDALADAGYVDGENIELDFQNAQGDANTLATIADRFVSQDKDLILAIATNPAQAMAAKTDTIPILGAGITSFTVAGLVESNEHPGGNVTGTSDMAPVKEQVDLLIALVPDAKTVGFIYSASEANAVEQVGLIRDELENRGLDTTEVTVVNTGDVQQAMKSLVKKCDAIYTPTDNTIAASMAVVSEVSHTAKVPVFPGATSMVEEGGLATAGVDYYELGRESGLMAIELLKGADPATTPVRMMTKNNTIEINGAVAEKLGIQIPERYQEFVK